MWNIFEHWWAALFLAACVQLFLALVHIIKPDTRKLWHIIIPISIIFAGVALERLVQTDFEKINRLIDSGLSAVKNQDAAAMDELLSPNYADSCHNSKAAMMEYCRGWFARPLVQNVKLYTVQIEINRPFADVNLAAFVHLDPKSGFGEIANIPLFVKVKLRLQRDGAKKWRIDCAELLEVNNQSLSWDKI